MTYSHTQYAPLGKLVGLIGVAMGASAWMTNVTFVTVLLLVVGTVFVLLGFAFNHLRVEDIGDALEVTFGPLTVFRKQIRYDEITSVEQSKSSFIDGWGIHSIPGRGTTWNLWGFDCVEFDVSGKRLRIGSDDASNLEAFLQERVASVTDQ